MSTTSLIVVIAVLGVGTYSMRFIGALIGDKVRLTPIVERLLPLGAVALLAALAATAALLDAGRFTGAARPAGVLAGVLAAWCKLPFIAVVIIAAAVAAGLRLLGVR
jgi:branched-subunit amino acid transport protein